MRPLDPGRGWTDDSARLTALGRFIRATSLDELPSLWNILVGDMSLIGPRPLTTEYLPLYTPEQSRRHAVRGGLSGLAQVSGRNALSWDERFDLDVEYVETMSLRTDLRILVRTVLTVFRRDGVSHPGSATMISFGGAMRSDLIEFEQIARTRELTQWMARTRSGERVGLCEMVGTGDAARIIRFLPDPTHSALEDDEHESLCREVSRPAQPGPGDRRRLCLLPRFDGRRRAPPLPRLRLPAHHRPARDRAASAPRVARTRGRGIPAAHCGPKPTRPPN